MEKDRGVSGARSGSGAHLSHFQWLELSHMADLTTREADRGSLPVCLEEEMFLLKSQLVSATLGHSARFCRGKCGNASS